MSQIDMSSGYVKGERGGGVTEQSRHEDRSSVHSKMCKQTTCTPRLDLLAASPVQEQILGFNISVAYPAPVEERQGV